MRWARSQGCSIRCFKSERARVTLNTPATTRSAPTMLIALGYSPKRRTPQGIGENDLEVRDRRRAACGFLA